MEQQQERPSVTVDDVVSFIDELPQELQVAFNRVMVMRRMREEKSAEKLQADLAVMASENILVEGVRAHRAKAVETVEAVETTPAQ